MKTTKTPPPATAAGDPLEVKLVFDLKTCRTCTFFWPQKGAQPYGPYPAYDFLQNYPKEKKAPSKDAFSYPWVDAITADPGFPEPEVVDGCRKAPIMTIGINPNLTAFLMSERDGTWVYPIFANSPNTNAYTKYAWYYRYRSVYQEHLDPAFINSNILQQGRIIAKEDGEVTLAEEKTDAPYINLEVKYASGKTEKIPLRWKLGSPRYVLLVNASGALSHFKKGDVLAGLLQVPAGKKVNVDRQQIGYYEQFVPVAGLFSSFLQSKGHKKADIRIGEDVCQLDMVACASPHWGPGFLGGSETQVNTIIRNCVTKNAWALKQFLQTNPAILYIVGEPSYGMFNNAFKKRIRSKTKLPARFPDGAFSLFRLTTDPQNPVFVEFSYKEGNNVLNVKTRLVVTPHFSYDTNFLPQFRLSPKQMKTLKSKYLAVYHLLSTNKDIAFEPPTEYSYAAFQISKDAPKIIAEIKSQYPDAYKLLSSCYYEAHNTMAAVLEDMYNQGTLSWTNDKNGGYISRNAGPCHFCVNDHWKFPEGCPYNKIKEKPLPASFLEKAAVAFISGK